MNEEEFDQIKMRIKELAAANHIDNAARMERLDIEEALLDSPYKSHLYIERDFEHLIFLELRELNTKIDRVLAHIAPDAIRGVCIGSSARANMTQPPTDEPIIERPYEKPGEVVISKPKRVQPRKHRVK